jgi:hypothetical protein
VRESERKLGEKKKEENISSILFEILKKSIKKKGSKIEYEIDICYFQAINYLFAKCEICD